MIAPFYVEILARNGDVLTRQQVHTLPIRLGRGYDNDVIIDDSHAGANHARIEADERGQLFLHDLGSQNGTVHLGRRQAVVPLNGETVVRMGHTNVRVRGADHPVPPPVADTTMHAWEGALPAMVGLVLIGAFAAFMTWIADFATFQSIRYLQAIAVALGAGALWAGVWAFGNRLFGRHARLGRHLFILGCGLTAMTVLKVASSMLAYAWSLEWATRYSSHAAIAIVCAMLFYHLSTIRPHHPRRFAGVCLAIMVLGVGLRVMSNQQNTGRAADELYMTVLLPPALRVSPNHSVDEFFGEAAKMKAGLDVERAKKVRGDTAEADDEE